jgi:oxepin-CoA hydrolase/3-oxo-5,6-dehydrosuberyl-CoA semialdehyde dehydrogenase
MTLSSEDKTRFLSEGIRPLLDLLSPDAVPLWGVMDAQQMVEHLYDFMLVSTGERTFPLSVPEEHLPQYKAFLWSEKPFRENTKAPANVLGETALPHRNPNLNEARAEFYESVTQFFHGFQQNPGLQTLHPAFGWLNEADWVQLHYKHITHHLRQFALMP